MPSGRFNQKKYLRQSRNRERLLENLSDLLPWNPLGYPTGELTGGSTPAARKLSLLDRLVPDHRAVIRPVPVGAFAIFGHHDHYGEGSTCFRRRENKRRGKVVKNC
ncbi:unnamed protein product [Bathycoccus prasinos]